MEYQEEFNLLMKEFKGGIYLFGEGALSVLGKAVKPFGNRPMLVMSRFPGIEPFVDAIAQSLAGQNLRIERQIVDFVRPNAPLEDMLLVREEIEKASPDVVISFGGGSTIDAVKAAIAVQVLGGDIEDYFGVGRVGEALASAGKKLTPHIAIQSAASSAAHLTKYSNITNLGNHQKKLIVDESVVPQVPVFDYAVTYNTPEALTLDGALDGLSHCMEVLFGAVGKPYYQKACTIASLAFRLIIKYLPVVIHDPRNKEARNALCMATDLGGYAIMIGGTSGAHLTSFSLVDLLSHGRACALMNPYYAVFYAPAIEEPLRILGNIYKSEGFSRARFEDLRGRDVGMAFAEAMLQFAKSIGFPTKLEQVEGFTMDHILRALAAAKNPQLRSKLENMPVPLTAELVDEYMGSILQAARTGDLTGVKNL